MAANRTHLVWVDPALRAPSSVAPRVGRARRALVPIGSFLATSSAKGGCPVRRCEACKRRLLCVYPSGFSKRCDHGFRASQRTRRSDTRALEGCRQLEYRERCARWRFLFHPSRRAGSRHLGVFAGHLGTGASSGASRCHVPPSASEDLERDRVPAIPRPPPRLPRIGAPFP